MFGLKGYAVGYTQEDGSIEEVAVIWYENEEEAIIGAKETALSLGDPVDKVVVRHVTDKDEIIEAMSMEISFLMEENEALQAELAEYDYEDSDAEWEILTQPIAKSCSKCGTVKPLDQFYTQREGKYGHRADCIDCKLGGVRKVPVDWMFGA